MRIVLAALAALLGAGAPALAAGYDDFTQGLTANLRGEYAVAVTAFTAALAAPDLAAAYKPAAYRGRAMAYLNTEACDKAKSDLDTFRSLKTEDKSIGGLRMWVDLCLKDNAGARGEFEKLVAGKLSAGDLWGFAQLQWRYGLYEESVATGRDAFKASTPDTQQAAYVLLWLAVSEQRAGKFDAAEIAADLKTAKLSDWPKPLIDLYLGKTTPAGVQKEAESWRSDREQAQRCEANFYTAEWHLGQSDTAAATPLLLEVVHSCPIDFIEFFSAKSELKRLGVPVPKE